jgi:hypothetical protein
MRLSKTQKIGLQAEKWALQKLLKQGYQAQLVSSWVAQYDILVGGLLQVEVKFSNQRVRYVRPGYYRPVWWFDVSRLPAGDMIVILICADDRGKWWPYVAPSWYFFGRHSVAITSHPKQYSGYLAKTLRNWSNVAWVLARRQQQSQQLILPLWGHSPEEIASAEEFLVPTQKGA